MLGSSHRVGITKTQNLLEIFQTIIGIIFNRLLSITSFFSSVVERGIAAIARHPKVPVSITGGSCSFGNFNALGQIFDNLPNQCLLDNQLLIIVAHAFI
jgi:hypothetical protein